MGVGREGEVPQLKTLIPSSLRAGGISRLSRRVPDSYVEGQTGETFFPSYSSISEVSLLVWVPRGSVSHWFKSPSPVLPLRGLGPRGDGG